MLVPSERASARGLSDLVRKMPFGRSKRAWVWAGVAVAAGLMLMIFDKEPAQKEGLPAVVANRDRSSTLEMRSSSEGVATEEVDKLAAARPAAPAAVPSSAPLAAADADRVGGGGGFGGAGAALGGRAAEAGDNQQRMVVYVNVKPEALRRRAFDAVLARNQIEVEQPVVGEMETRASASAPQEPQEVDVLLLDAAPAQIASTLADLNADPANYLDIEVEAERAESERSQAAEPTDKALAQYNFTQYNRGVVPLQQKLPETNNRDYFETIQGPIDLERRLGREAEFKQRQLSEETPADSNRGRAVRLQPQSISGSDLKSGVLADDLLQQSGETATEPSAPALGQPFGGAKLDLARRGKQKLIAQAETLQVLFVLTAGAESTASQRAAVKRVTSPVTEERGIEE
jgi:hypothetical protein